VPSLTAAWFLLHRAYRRAHCDTAGPTGNTCACRSAVDLAGVLDVTGQQAIGNQQVLVSAGFARDDAPLASGVDVFFLN